MEEKTFSPRRTNESLSNRYQFAEWFSTLWFFLSFWKPQSNFHNEIRILFPSLFDAMNQIKLRNFRRTSISHWLIFTPAKIVVIVLLWLSLDLYLFCDFYSVVVATRLLLKNEIHVLIHWKPLICLLPPLSLVRWLFLSVRHPNWTCLFFILTKFLHCCYFSVPFHLSSVSMRKC